MRLIKFGQKILFNEKDHQGTKILDSQLNLLQSLSRLFTAVDVTLVQTAFVAGGLTEMLVKLELQYVRNEVPDVRNGGRHLWSERKHFLNEFRMIS